MRLTASYKVRLKGLTRADKAALKATVETYRDAVGFLVGVVDEEWDAVEALSSKARVNAVERAVHATRKNPLPKHGEFDRLFYKLPSYLRRAAISNAVGAVSSYRSSLASWEGMTRKERRGKLGNVNSRVCVFPTGKVYDADLNAAYNIAARYIVRAMLESLPETAKLAAQAKVPGCAKRTTCTLSSLIDLGRALAA